MTTYPIKAPEGCPDYMVASVQQTCDGAISQVFRGDKVEHLRHALNQAKDGELSVLRSVIDGKTPSDNWWVKWGYRVVTRAWEDAVQLARFRDALADPNFDHVTSGHSVSPDSFHVYVQDPTSPTGCHHVASAGFKLPGANEILAASRKNTCAGGQRGSMRAG